MRASDFVSFAAPKGEAEWVMPTGRTYEYLVWRSCERIGVLPPGLAKTWEDCSVPAQAMMVAYEEVRLREEASKL